MINKSKNFLNYLDEYQSLVYDFYGKEYAAYPCVYYRLNFNESIQDTKLFEAGAYEILGDLSGLKWDKIFMLPIMFVEPIQNVVDNFTEYGKSHDISTSFVIPSSYNFDPLYNDIVTFPASIRSNDEAEYPLFIVTGREKAIMSKRSVWKITVKVFQGDVTTLEKQIKDEYVFVDYYKKIYPVSIGQELIQLSQMFNDKYYVIRDNHVHPTSNMLYYMRTI